MESAWKAGLFQFEIARLDLIHELKSRCYDILLLEEKENVAARSSISLKELHSLAEKRARLGEIRELEAVKLYVESLKADSELNRVRTELRLARQNLAAQVDHALPSNFQLEGELNFTPLLFEEEALLRKALSGHPRVKKKEEELALAENNLSFVKWQRLPDAELTGFISREIDGTNTGVGLGFELPLWNWKTNALAEAAHQVEREKSGLRAVRLALEAEVRTALGNLRIAAETLGVFTSGLLGEAEQSLKIAELSYRQGEISLLDFLDSQRTYFSILYDYQESLRDWNIQRATLEKTVGEDVL